jgi:cytoskeletal protein CcmA (bactofilin family)
MLRRAFGDQGKTTAHADAARHAADAQPDMREGDAMEKQREWNAADTRPADTRAGELNALLGKGSEFDGKLVFEGTVRIDGTFTGEITTSDMLIIGDSAKVTAEVSCGTIVVHGEVVGNIKATQAVELHKPARVKGDVSTPSLMIERGVVFEGRSKMEDLESNIVRMPASAAEAD